MRISTFFVGFFLSTVSAHAFTYDIFRTVGEGTVEGTLSVSQLGIVTTGTITDWTFTLSSSNISNAPVDTFSRSTGTEIILQGLFATETELTYDFDDASNSSGAFFRNEDLNAPGYLNYYCLNSGIGTNTACSNVVGAYEAIGSIQPGYLPSELITPSGTQVIGTRMSSVPVPASFMLFMTALGGLGLLRGRQSS